MPTLATFSWLSFCLATMAETAAKKLVAKHDPKPPKYRLPHIPNKRFPELSTKGPSLNWAADRRFAFTLLKLKEGRYDSHACYLPSLGQIFANSIYRKVVTKNYSAALFESKDKSTKCLKEEEALEAQRARRREKELKAKERVKDAVVIAFDQFKAERRKEEAKRQENEKRKAQGQLPQEEKEEEKKEEEKEVEKTVKQSKTPKEVTAASPSAGWSRTLSLGPVSLEVVWFLYKTYFRADSSVMLDAFISMMTYLAKMASDDVKQNSAVDWMSAVPLATRSTKHRLGFHTTIGLGSQPLNVRCQPLLVCRKRFAHLFKKDRGFSPLCLAVNTENVLHSMRHSEMELSKKFRSGKDFKEIVEKFKRENKLMLEHRVKKIPTILMPFGHFHPFDMWTPPPHQSNPGLNCSVFFGKLTPFQVLSEFHQFPANFPLHYNLLRVNAQKAPLTIEMDAFPYVDCEYEKKTSIRNDIPAFQCRKLGKVEFLKPREITPLSIGRSIYANEVNPAVTFREKSAKETKNGKKGLVSQVFRYDEYECESLGTVSGFSTASFASTATITPRNFLYNWENYSKPKDNAFYKGNENTFQNVRILKTDAQMRYSCRLAIETDERIIRANISQSRKLCYDTRNQYFKKIMEFNEGRRIRRREAEEIRLLYVLNCLQVMEQTQDEEGVNIPLQSQLLELSYRKLIQFYPELDESKGLDLSPCWRAAIECGAIREMNHPVLGNLISSHDSWVVSSPVSDSSRTWRYDKKPIEEEEKALPALDMVWNVVLIIIIIILLFIVALEEPFNAY